MCIRSHWRSKTACRRSDLRGTQGIETRPETERAQDPTPVTLRAGTFFRRGSTSLQSYSLFQQLPREPGVLGFAGFANRGWHKELAPK